MPQGQHSMEDEDKPAEGTAGSRVTTANDTWLLPLLQQARDALWQVHAGTAQATSDATPTPDSAHAESDSQPAAEPLRTEHTPPADTLDWDQFDGRSDCIFLPPEDTAREERPSRDEHPQEIIPEDPAARPLPENPYGFGNPPADALVTMALVEWVNQETGERWTAPSGGYVPPSEAWTTEIEAEWPSDGEAVEPLEPEPQPPVDNSVSYAHHETRDLEDDSGTIIGYEMTFVSGDASGAWSRSTQVYFLDGRVGASTYEDSSGFGYAFETLWSEDGTVLGQHHRYWGADSYFIENYYDAEWRLLSSTYQTGDGSFRSSTEFSYGPDGSMTGGTTVSVWRDETGEYSQTDSFSVEPVPAVYLPPDEIPVDEDIHVDPVVGILPVTAEPDGDTADEQSENATSDVEGNGETTSDFDLLPFEDVDWTFIGAGGGSESDYEPEIAVCWWEFEAPRPVNVLAAEGGDASPVDGNSDSDGIDPCWLRPAVLDGEIDAAPPPAPLVGVMDGSFDILA